jgi:two-component system, sensor histidine kinase
MMVSGLIVEDNEALAFVLTEYLHDLNITVDQAYNGLEAVEKTKLNNYDFILMDIHMPIMNGFDATRQILNLKPSSIILVITSSHEQLECLRMQLLGAKECIIKPISAPQLKELIKRYVQL